MTTRRRIGWVAALTTLIFTPRLIEWIAQLHPADDLTAFLYISGLLAVDLTLLIVLGYEVDRYVDWT